MNEANARLCGRFVLREKIGAGGFGEVWRAYDEVREQDVALKILYPQLTQSPAAWQVLEREFTLSSRLNHPGVLRVHEPVRDERCAVLPMTYAPGGDLRSLRGQRYTRIVPLLIEVARALEHAHSRGIVHRDLKSGNVLLDVGRRVLLADFGSAAAEGDADNSLPGSPFTASPQQLAGEPPTAADDIYGLGALAYELLSGAPPFYPNFDVARVRNEPAPPLRPAYPVPPRLEHLIIRMLAKRPAARPATMHDVASELNAVLHDTLAAPEEMLQALRDDAGAYPDPEANTTLDALNVTQALPMPDADRDDDLDIGIELDSPPRMAPPEPPQHAEPPAAVRDGNPHRAAGSRTRATDKIMVDAFDEAANDGDDLPLVDLKELVDSARAPLPRIEDVFRAGSSRPRARRTGVWLAATALVAAAVGVFFWLPKLAVKPQVTAQPAAAESAAAVAAREELAKSLANKRAEVDALQQRLGLLDQRAAALWSGENFARAKSQLAEAGVALERSDLELATTALRAADKTVAAIEAEAPAALEAQLAAGDGALLAADVAIARQAYETAARIEPDNARARAGLASLAKLLDAAPLLAQAEAAVQAGDSATAERVYAQVLAKYPGNAAATTGLQQLRQKNSDAAFARAMGDGFAALTAGRTDSARAAFTRAQALRPEAAEVREAIAQVDAANRGAADANLEALAARLVAEERWTEALALYEKALATDPTLEFAQRGKTRAQPRADLSRRLQNVIERPERLASAEVRAETDRLLLRARGLPDQGPVIRSQISRLEMLLPAFDRPVTLALESDNATEVAIQRVGYFGTFERRELELKPGQYTIIGRRQGYRDVRRDFTLAPGTDTQTIVVRCVEPI
ncbi:MAG: protein kinase [Steroidobacteraceae bacterium]